MQNLEQYYERDEEIHIEDVVDGILELIKGNTVIARTLFERGFPADSANLAIIQEALRASK